MPTAAQRGAEIRVTVNGADGFGDFGMGACDFTTTFGGAPCVVVVCVAAALCLCLLYRSTCTSQPHDGVETLCDGVVVDVDVVVANLIDAHRWQG